jgi:hypothetical protein
MAWFNQPANQISNRVFIDSPFGNSEDTYQKETSLLAREVEGILYLAWCYGMAMYAFYERCKYTQPKFLTQLLDKNEIIFIIHPTLCVLYSSRS